MSVIDKDGMNGGVDGPVAGAHRGGSSRAELPAGMIDRHEVCRMFGVSLATLANWQRAGKLRSAGWARTSSRRPIKLFARAELEALLQEMRGPDAVYRIAGNQYHIADGMVGIEEACEMFGVNRNVWNRWVHEGRVACGVLCDGGRIRVYPVAELNKLLAECGRYSPPYPDPDRPGCWRVPLTGHDIRRREAIIDEADLKLIEGNSCYWSRWEPDQDGHVRISGTNTPLHHAVMGVKGKKWRVHHINGDTLDCRRSNLVVQTLSERAAGMRKAKMFRGKPCSSRFKGVCWDRAREKWLAHIKKDQVMRSLGHFDNEIDAAEARDKAARELFGEHARLNFPDDCSRNVEEAALARAA